MDSGGGLSRRHIFAGAAWTAPAIVIATAVPAQATSLPPLGGVLFQSLAAHYTPFHWMGSAGVTAVVAQANIWNAQGAPAITSFTLAYTIPVGAVPPTIVGQPPQGWGLGADGAPQALGIASGAPYSLVPDIAIANGLATLTFLYEGPALSAIDTVQPTLWVQVAGDQAGNIASATVNAQHGAGVTSSASQVDEI